MKRLLPFMLLLCSISAYSQRYVIIDRKLKMPLQLADNISKEQLAKGFFVVEKQNLNPLIGKLDSLSARLRKVVRESYDENKLVIGSTILNIKVIKQSFADRLNIALSTDIGNGHEQSFYIADAKLTNNDNARYINRLVIYLKKVN